MNWPPPPPPEGFALPPGVRIGDIPGMQEDEDMRAGNYGTLFNREQKDDAEMIWSMGLGLAFHGPEKEGELW